MQRFKKNSFFVLLISRHIMEWLYKVHPAQLCSLFFQKLKSFWFTLLSQYSNTLKFAKNILNEQNRLEGSIYNCTSKYGKKSVLNSPCRKIAITGRSKTILMMPVRSLLPVTSRLSQSTLSEVKRAAFIVFSWRLASRASACMEKFVNIALIF